MTDLFNQIDEPKYSRNSSEKRDENPLSQHDPVKTPYVDEEPGERPPVEKDPPTKHPKEKEPPLSEQDKYDPSNNPIEADLFWYPIGVGLWI